MNVQKYEAFVKSVEHGSFTKAGEKLNYSQSAISRMIGDLEKEWGITLLKRGKSGVKLTAEGERLMPYAKKICEDCKKLEQKIGDMNSAETGLIRIGTFSSMAEHWLPGIIKGFTREHPGIDYELLLGDYDEIEQWIAEGRVDCGFLTAPVPSKFEHLFMKRDDFLAVLPQGHPLLELDEIPVEKLCGEPFMLLQKGTKREIEKIFGKCASKPETKFTTWDDYAIMSMIECGLGISILPELIMRRCPYNVETRKLSPTSYRDICISFESRRTLSSVANKFLQYIADEKTKTVGGKNP